MKNGQHTGISEQKPREKKINKIRPPDDLDINIIKYRYYRLKDRIAEIKNLIEGLNSKIIKSKRDNQ